AFPATLAVSEYENAGDEYGRIVVRLQTPPLWWSAVKVTQPKEPMSWLTPTVRLKDQNGWTRDTNVKRIARPIMKKDDSTRRNSWSFVRKRGTRRIVPRNEGLG